MKQAFKVSTFYRTDKVIHATSQGQNERLKV